MCARLNAFPLRLILISNCSITRELADNFKWTFARTWPGETMQRMAERPANLAQLAAIDHVAVDVSLAEALEYADPVTAVHIVDMLLERGRVPGFAGLIRHFDKLPLEAQKLILEHAGRLDEAMRHVAQGEDVQSRLNVIDIIHRTSSVRLAWLLSQQLHASDSRLNKAAAMALLRLSRHHLIVTNGEEGASPSSMVAERYLINALAEACACFHQHRRRDVLLALLCFTPNLPAGLYRYVADHKTPTFNPLSELVLQADHPIVCRAMLGLLTVEQMQPFVVRALGQATAGGQLPFILRLAHLLNDPTVHTALRKIKRTDQLMPERSQLNQMDLQTQRRMAQWVDVLPTPSNAPTKKINVLADLAASGDRLTRLAALKVLMYQSDLDQTRADEIIATLCFDGEMAIARLALRHLLRTRWAELGELIIRLIGSEHSSIRELAEHHLGPVGFEKYWANWPHMNTSTRRTAGRALMKLDPQFLAKLAHRMADSSADHRLQAVQIARQLGQETYFEQQLLALVSDVDTRVVSAAVRALAVLRDSSKAMAAVSGALAHKDDRVRANAVESLESMQRVGQVQETLMDLAAGRGNRSRANAIKALMGLPVNEAVAALTQMLADEDERHRISALWVVERLNLMPLVEQVAELARRDDDRKVRRRAVRVVQDLAKHAMTDHKQAG